MLGFTETGARQAAQPKSAAHTKPGLVTQSPKPSWQLSLPGPRAPLQRCEEQVWLARRAGAEMCAGISLLLLSKAKLFTFPQKYI